MTLSFAFFTFLNAWVISLFLAFPFSITMPESRGELDYQAAPKEIHWRRLFKIATAIATIFTLLLAFITKSGIVQI